MSLVVWTRLGAIRLAAVSLRPIGEFESGLRQVSVEFCHVGSCDWAVSVVGQGRLFVYPKSPGLEVQAAG